MSAPAVLAAPKGAAPSQSLGKLLGMACDLCGTEDQLVLAGTLCSDGQWRTFRVCLAAVLLGSFALVGWKCWCMRIGRSMCWSHAQRCIRLALRVRCFRS